MRIATWNVNSLRSRIDRVEALLERHDIDVLALQETKAREDQLPLMGLQSMGYDVAYSGTNQWNGVAIVSRVGLEDVEAGFPGSRLGRAGRGRSRGRSARPAATYASGRSTCPTAASSTTRTTSTSSTGWPGSAKTAHGVAGRRRPRSSATGTSRRTDEDVFDVAQFANSTHVTPPERAAFQAFLDDGYVDVVRPHTPGPDVYTYWDYYRQRFERNRGLRIDFVLGSPSFAVAGHGRVHRPRRAGRPGSLRPRPGGGRPRLIRRRGSDDGAGSPLP